MKPYRFNLARNERMAKRNKVIQILVRSGMTKKSVADLFNLSPSRVGQIVHNGSFATKP